jgi:hypothetical protein
MAAHQSDGGLNVVSIIKSIAVPTGILVNATAQEALEAGANQEAVDAALSDQAMEILRAQRHAALVQSDWAVMPDSPLDPKAREAWIKYRQELRDLPADMATKGAVVSFDDVTWPSAPVSEVAEKRTLKDEK